MSGERKGTAMKRVKCVGPSVVGTLAFASVWALTILTSARADVVYHEVDGVVACEGEIYSSRTYRYEKSVSNSWYVVPFESAGTGTFVNARNNAFIQCLPDNGSGGGPTNPPSVSYKMKISVPGIYRLYLRWGKNCTTADTAGSSDSMFVDIEELKDGTGGVFNSPTNMIADWYEFAGGPTTNDFTLLPWTSACKPEVNDAGASGYNADWFIPKAGLYTLRLSQREDGAAVDAFVFQRNNLPAPTGDGPAMSPLEQPKNFVFATTDDTYLRRDDTNAFRYAETMMVIKNDDGANPSSLDRVAFLRFDVSDLATLDEDMVLTKATFKIDLLDEGSGTNHAIYVAVIAEDAAAENFSETNLWPGVCDVWDGTVDEAVDFSKVHGGAPVGSFEISANLENKTISFSTRALLQAVRADTDGVLSLALFRTFDGIQGDNLSSKENTAKFPPRLEVSFCRGDPGTLIMFQ